MEEILRKMKKKTLCSIVGGLMLGGCAAMPLNQTEIKAPPTDYSKSGNLMPIPMGPMLYLHYDTDSDGVSDKLMVYSVVGRIPQGPGVYKLGEVYIDNNKDGQFAPDELVYQSDMVKKYKKEQERQNKGKGI